MIRIESGGYTYHYAYDGLNRRISTTIMYGETSLLEMHFYYNTNWQVLETRTGTGGGAVSSNPLRQMAWHPYYVDAQVCQFVDQDRDGELDENDDGQYYVVQDANFNVTALIDDSGDVFERYRYSPYGEVTVLDPDFSPDANNSSDVSNPYTYTGRRLDFESGLYCFRNRYYSAQLGRFVSRDPIGYTGGGANLYEYVGGSPAGSVDPLGLQPGIGNLKPQDRFIGNILRSFEKFHYDYVPSSRGPTYSWGSPEKNDDFTCYATFTYFEMETRLTKDTMFNVFATADPEKLAALRNKMRQLFQQMTRLTKHRNDARSLARTLGNTSDALLVVATISFIFSFTGNPVAAGIGVSALVHGEALAIASSNQDALADRLDARIWDLNNDFRDIQMQLATGQGLMDKQYEVKVGDFNKEESQAVWTKVTKTRVIPVSPLYCVCPEIAVDAFGVPPAPKIPSRETEWMEIEPGLFIASCVVRKRVLAVV